MLNGVCSVQPQRVAVVAAKRTSQTPQPASSLKTGFWSPSFLYFLKVGGIQRTLGKGDYQYINVNHSEKLIRKKWIIKSDLCEISNKMKQLDKYLTKRSTHCCFLVKLLYIVVGSFSTSFLKKNVCCSGCLFIVWKVLENYS